MEGDSAAEGGSNVVEVNLPTDIILKMNLNVIKMVWVQNIWLPNGRSFLFLSLTQHHLMALLYWVVGVGRWDVQFTPAAKLPFRRWK